MATAERNIGLLATNSHLITVFQDSAIAIQTRERCETCKATSQNSVSAYIRRI